LADQDGNCQGPELMLSTYNKYYVFGPEGMAESGATQSIEGNEESNTTRPGPSVDGAIESHPGPPWFQWQEGSRYPEFYILHQGWSIHCPYIWYKVVHRVPYKKGTTRQGEQQIA